MIASNDDQHGQHAGTWRKPVALDKAEILSIVSPYCHRGLAATNRGKSTSPQFHLKNPNRSSVCATYTAYVEGLIVPVTPLASGI